uniref:Uncharacterized protein n=1 Tax=Oryza sativa subsp. japonica TaxID=39947 RepID=Q94LE4_ORYSJ|nr:hypothetical protein OSJNBa0015K03.13 [Oryza sativa Japonica Group]
MAGRALVPGAVRHHSCVRSAVCRPHPWRCSERLVAVAWNEMRSGRRRRACATTEARVTGATKSRKTKDEAAPLSLSPMRVRSYGPSGRHHAYGPSGHYRAVPAQARPTGRAVPCRAVPPVVLVV